MPSAAADAGREAKSRVLARGARAAFVLLAGALLWVPGAGSATAQEPELRIGTDAVQGRVVGGAPAFPATALERLGFRLASSDASLIATTGTDTLRFWATSPWFRVGGVVHHLAHPVASAAGVTWLPEQFFIQWLPTAFPDRYEYRGGAVLARAAAIAAAPAPAPPAAAAPPRADGTPPAANRTPEPAAAASGAGRRAAGTARIAIIDAGHGGRDPGKVGPNGLRESDVALLISQRLAAILRERGYEVHLTRTTDTFVPLAERTRLANDWQAGRPGTVFLSIHANSHTSTTARGFETFFLSEARTDDERRVAEMENAVIRFEDSAQRPAGTGLDQVLLNLHSEYLTRASHDLAAIMQERMASFHPGPNRGVKRAPFYVLVGAVMPAVLVETAFISHREEANLLGTQSFQQRLAWGIADGVDEFFRRNEHLWASPP